VLLILFLITTPLMEQSLDVTLPKTSSSNSAADPAAMNVTHQPRAEARWLDALVSSSFL
jgi:biopolymer transport protein ExbD